MFLSHYRAGQPALPELRLPIINLEGTSDTENNTYQLEKAIVIMDLVPTLKVGSNSLLFSYETDQLTKSRYRWTLSPNLLTITLTKDR